MSKVLPFPWKRRGGGGILLITVTMFLCQKTLSNLSTGCWTRGDFLGCWWSRWPLTGSGAGMGNETRAGFIKDEKGSSNDGLNSFFPFFFFHGPICGLRLCAAHSHWQTSMETLLFLFPQFNYMAPKEEAYFRMFAVEDLQSRAMKDDSGRLVSELDSFSVI